MHTDWDNTMVTEISGIKIDKSSDAKVFIFTDNDLTYINKDHFEINLVARLLNHICVVPVPPPGYDYDNSLLHLSQHEYIFYTYRITRYNFIHIYKIISECMMFYLFVLCIIELKM